MDRASRHPWLVRAEKLGRALENALLIALLGGLSALAFAQIVLRNVFSIGLPWADGLIRLAVLWLAVIGAIAASRDGKHIAINLAERALPARIGRPVNAVIDLFTAVVAAWLAWYSWSFVRDSRAFEDVLLGTWPAWIFQLILPIGFALVGYRYALRCVSRIRAEHK